MVRKREDCRWEGRIVIGHKDNGNSIFRYIYTNTQSVLRSSPLNHYRNDLEHHVKPYLGHKGLTQITATDLRKLYDTLKQRGRVHLRPS